MKGNQCLFLELSGRDETLTGSDEVIVSGSAGSNQKWHAVLEPILVAAWGGWEGRRKKPLHDKQSQRLIWQSWMWHRRGCVCVYVITYEICQWSDLYVYDSWPFQVVCICPTFIYIRLSLCVCMCVSAAYCLCLEQTAQHTGFAHWWVSIGPV